MRRILFGILVLIFLISVSIPTFAASNTYSENATSFVYTDTDSGITFTVPANWKQKDFSEDKEFIDAKFVSEEDNSCVIIFGSTDMWEQTPASDRVGYNRSDFDNSAFSTSDMAMVMGTTADMVSVVTYNGIKYYKGETRSLFLSMTTLVYIDNGWMYMFQFSKSNAHELYDDFESLLNSVQYPFTFNTSVITGVVTLTLIIAVIVVLSVIIIKKDAKKKIQVDRDPNCNTAVPQPMKSEESTVPCANCGQALPPDSDFCHICGTKIIKKEDV